MGKLTIILTPETEKEMRNYIARKYPTEIYGKISEVIETALKGYLQNHQWQITHSELVFSFHPLYKGAIVFSVLSRYTRSKIGVLDVGKYPAFLSFLSNNLLDVWFWEDKLDVFAVIFLVLLTTHSFWREYYLYSFM